MKCFPQVWHWRGTHLLSMNSFMWLQMNPQFVNFLTCFTINQYFTLKYIFMTFQVDQQVESFHTTLTSKWYFSCKMALVNFKWTNSTTSHTVTLNDCFTSLGGNPKIWPILGGESSNSGGRIGLKFSEGGEYFATESPSWRGGI